VFLVVFLVGADLFFTAENPVQIQVGEQLMLVSLVILVGSALQRAFRAGRRKLQ
jgi:hypothetical protein